jgi:hypothetical protein
VVLKDVKEKPYLEVLKKQAEMETDSTHKFQDEGIALARNARDFTDCRTQLGLG